MQELHTEEYKNVQVLREETKPLEVREIHSLQEDHPGKSYCSHIRDKPLPRILHQCEIVVKYIYAGISFFPLLFFKVSD